MDVSIIIINYNTWKLTLKCIDSIFMHTKDVLFEVIVVDNASTDESKTIFSNDSRIKYIYLKKNIGFGRANNKGYEQAKGNYILLLNSDTIIQNNAVKIFYDEIKNMPPNIGYIGTVLTDIDGNYSPSYGNFKKIDSELKHLFKRYLNKLIKFKKDFTLIPPKINHYKIVEVVIGADLFIKNEIIKKYGLFDPRFFMYHEENDMERKFFEAGYSGAIINKAKIIHLEGKSSKKISRLIFSTTSLFIYLKKWNPRLNYYIFRILYALLYTPIILIDYSYSKKEKMRFLKLLFSKIQ